MKERTLRGKVAIAGIGETRYYKHGQSSDSEFALALQAILRACADAGIDPRQVGVVDQDPSAGRFVHLREQLDERGLAGAVFPDDGHHGAGR